jgi:zinc protease
MTLRFGDEKNLVNKGTAGQYAASMLDKGTSKMTRQQIKDEFDKLKARVSFSGGATAVSVSIETTSPNLEETLKLVGHILKEASFPTDEFEKLKNEKECLEEKDSLKILNQAIDKKNKILQKTSKVYTIPYVWTESEFKRINL